MSRAKILIARVVRKALGERRYRNLTGHKRRDHSVLLGDLADPEKVPNPFAQGRIPEGCDEVKPRDEILPVYDPLFTSADEADWSLSDMVIGISLDGEARAYPVGPLNKREMVLDRIGETPIVVSWCPRCGTGLVHSRMLEGRELVFGNQGALCADAMTFWDHETGSVWSQPTGTAIAGPLKGKQLDLLRSTVTTWRSWVNHYPNTKALRVKRRPGHHTMSDLSIAVTLLGTTTTYAVDLVRERSVINDEIAGSSVAVMVEPADRDSWSVFSSLVDGAVLTFDVLEGNVVDTATETTWDPWSGVGIEGPLAGRVLEKIPASTVLPKDILTIWPDATIYE